MAKRGRPPHPDILTPREWEVLDLLDRGLTNDEIARRLGISFDGAKFHVAQILSKLGVASRREAASVAYGQRRSPLRRLVLAPFGWAAGVSRVAKLVGAGTLATAISAFVVFVVLVLAKSPAKKVFDMYPGLYVLDLKSGQVQRVTDLRGQASSQFAWSLDGRSFVLTRQDRRDGPVHIQVVDAGSGAVIRQDDFNFDAVSFTPLRDGRLGLTIRQQRRDSEGHEQGIGILDPLTMTLAGFQPVKNLDRVSWKPDGTQAVVDGEFDESNAFPTETRLLSLNGLTGPVAAEQRTWSPDGSLYATEDFFNHQLQIHEVSGGDVRATISGYQPRPYAISFSPDAKWLAVIDGRIEEGQEAELRLAATDASGPFRVLAQGATPSDYENGAGAWLDWSADSTSIAFVHDGELWTVQAPSGSPKRRLDVVLPVITEPRWSPDGTMIAFRAAGGGGLYLAKADGSQTRYVAPMSDASLSADGTRIAFNLGSQVFTMGVDGTNPISIGRLDFAVATDFYPRHFCQIQFPFDYRPTLSRDATFVAYTQGAFGDPPDIFIAKSDGLSTPGFFDKGFTPRWSPDGLRLAYVRDCTLIMSEFSGKPGSGPLNPIVITGYRFTWLPDGGLSVLQSDGGYVIFDRNGRATNSGPPRGLISSGGEFTAVTESFRTPDPEDPEHTSPDSRVKVLDMSGSVIRTLDHATVHAFSPDGKLLAYGVRQPFHPDETLFIVDMKTPGSAPREVATFRGVAQAVWSPNSRKLAFIERTEDGQSKLDVLDVGTLTLKTIADKAGNPQWFPDSKRILYQGP